MISEHEQFLLRLAQWLSQQERKVVSDIRAHAGTEETYLLFMREYDRVRGQVVRARYLQVRATLTLVEWFSTLIYFQWRCAYCQEHPFQVLHHVTPREEGGTCAENCVPACYRCLKIKKREDQHVKAYLTARQQGSPLFEEAVLITGYVNVRND